MTEQQKQRKGITLTTQILIGLSLGVATGLFFGEKAGALAIVGKAYIGLIQMSILPYMVVSLISGIGHLNYAKARDLAISGGIVLVGSWLLAFLVVFSLPLAFPRMEAGSFFSTSLVEVADVDFIDLYIPVNPISSMARTIVPASAVFSVVVGIALIGVEEKQKLLDVLSTTSKALTRVAMMVVRLTPIGVFAIAANASGTMTIEEFGRLQSYITTFVIATLLLTFWILPALAAALTPFTYRDIIRASRDALTTGFVTGNLFIVLPLLVERAKELFEQNRLRNDDSDSYVEVLVPTSFNFPNLGKLLTLLFVLFAGWYTGREIGIEQYPGFSVMGLLTLFGGVDLALPFLLDQMRIPSDMYQLYVVTGVINSWFATLLAVMNLFAFTLVAACAATGTLRINWKRLSNFAWVSVGLFAFAIIGSRGALSIMVGEEPIQRRTLMQLEIQDPVPVAMRDPGTDKEALSRGRLASILARGTLRVGYNPESLPFAFFNDKDRLVGYDIALMHDLARDMGVTLEFIPWRHNTLYAQLDSEFDLMAGGFIVYSDRLLRASFSSPYMEITTALVVPDHLRRQFRTWEEIEEDRSFRLGVAGQDLSERAKKVLPNTDIVELDSNRELFENNPKGVTAIVASAEAGSAWTILYPAYSVIVPKPNHIAPIALAIPKGEPAFEAFVDDWLRVKKINGTLDRLYDKWILGKSKEAKKQRWSIGRNVMGLWE